MPGGSGGSQTAKTSQNTTFDQTSSAEPWGPFKDFITGSVGEDGKPNGVTPGLLPSLNDAFRNSTWTPEMAATTAAHVATLQNDQGINAGVHNTALNLLNGELDPKITAVGPITGAAPITPRTASLTDARAGQGVLDPTNALKGFLTGESANPWVEKQGKAITDKLTRNFNESILPNIRSGAVLSGTYGGNRQGLAEGAASARLAGEIAPALTALGGNAYEAEQGRKYGTAMGLNDQAVATQQNDIGRELQADTTNAGLEQQTQQFNTGTQFTNNQQELQRAQQDVSNRLAGTNVAGASANLENQRYAELLKSLGAEGDFDWNNLAKYSSIFQPMMNQFQTQKASGTGTMQGTQVIPQQQSNPFGQILGGGLSLASLAGGLGWKPFG